jgi:hypothetical protein
VHTSWRLNTGKIPAQAAPHLGSTGVPRAFGICTVTGLRVRFGLRGPLFNLSLLAREIASYIPAPEPPLAAAFQFAAAIVNLQGTLSGPGRRAKPLNLQANAAHTGGARLALLVRIRAAGCRRDGRSAGSV